MATSQMMTGASNVPRNAQQASARRTRLWRYPLVLFALSLGLILLLVLRFMFRSALPSLSPRKERAPSSTAAGVVRRPVTSTRTTAWVPVDTSPPGQRSVFLDPRVPDPPPAPAIKLVVKEDGLYVTFADLASVPGWETDVDPRTFHLLRRGESIPIRVEGEDDGHFDPGDRILFYGQKRHGSPMFTKYSDEEVYWLTWGGAPGPRVTTVEAQPIHSASIVTTTQRTVRLEENYYWYTHHGLDLPTRQTWWWLLLAPAGNPVTQTVSLTLPAMLPGSAIVLGYDVVPRTKTGTHHLRVKVDGGPTYGHQFVGHAYVTFTDTIPSGVVKASPLSVAVSVDPMQGFGTEQGFDKLYVNGFTVIYTSTLEAVRDRVDVPLDLGENANVYLTGFSSTPIYVWDVAGEPRQLQGMWKSDSATLVLGLSTGKHHLVAATEGALLHPDVRPYRPVELRQVSEGADLIIIAHPEVWQAAEELAAYRRRQGYRVKVVNVTSLYDEFGWGWYHPEAIRAFLAYAYTHWPRPAPRYVILFGDGHWNFKAFNLQLYGPLPANFIPPYLAWVDPYQGEVPVDIAYGMVAGNDDIPDLIVGRIPVANLAQARAVVAKIIAYEQGNWLTADGARALVFAADYPDEAGNYTALVERLIQAHRPAWGEVERIYLEQMSAEEAHTALLSALNRGAWLVLYQGHGAVKRWGRHAHILTADDIPQLANHRVWPLVLTLNCLDGYFAYPRTTYEAIAELMLRRDAAGSIAAWSPAGLGTPWIHVMLADALLDDLFSRRTNILGEMIHRARLRFYEDIGPNEVFFTQTLYGDPLLHIQYPVPKTQLHLPVLLSGK